RLAGVRVADERHGRHVGAQALLAADLTLPFDAIETLAQVANALREQAPVGLELRLAGTAQADAALLALEVSPTAHEASGHVLELRQLDLELALERRGTLREDVENQAVAVEHARFDLALDIAL